MTYATPNDRSEYKALVESYLAKKALAKQQFLEEKIGQSDFQFETSRLFNPITSTIATTSDAQAATMKALQEKTAQDNNALLRALTYQTNVLEESRPNPFVVYPDPQAIEAAPLAKPTFKPPLVSYNHLNGLDLDLLKPHDLPPPDSFMTASKEEINKQMSEAKGKNISWGKKPPKLDENPEISKAKVDRIMANNVIYRANLGEIITDRSKVVKEGWGFILNGTDFAKLKIDPRLLRTGRLVAYKGGSLVMDTMADPSLQDLLTKRYIEGRKYTPQAVSTFGQLVKLSELPMYGRSNKNKKAKLLHNASSSCTKCERSCPDVVYYHDPNQLVERFGLLDASRRAGNTGVDNEISSILDELVNRHVIIKEVAAKLY